MRFKKTLQLIGALAITLHDLKETFLLLDPWVLLASFVLYGIAHVFRAARYYHLLGKKLSFKDTFSLTCAHNMFVGVMPFRSGELSFPYLLRKRNINTTTSLTSLGVGRIFDMYVVCSFFLIAVSLSYRALPPTLVHLTPYVIGLVVSLVILSLLAITHAMAVADFLLRWSKRRWWQWAGRKMKEVVAGFKQIHSPKTISLVLLFTCLTWLMHFYWTYLLFASLFNANFWTIVAGSTLPTISTALPVQGLGSFGTLELFWAYSFQAVGVEKTLAIASGFAFHIVNLVYFVALGIYGTIAFLRQKN